MSDQITVTAKYKIQHIYWWVPPSFLFGGKDPTHHSRKQLQNLRDPQKWGTAASGSWPRWWGLSWLHQKPLPLPCICSIKEGYEKGLRVFAKVRSNVGQHGLRSWDSSLRSICRHRSDHLKVSFNQEQPWSWTADCSTQALKAYTQSVGRQDYSQQCVGILPADVSCVSEATDDHHLRACDAWCTFVFVLPALSTYAILLHSKQDRNYHFACIVGSRGQPLRHTMMMSIDWCDYRQVLSMMRVYPIHSWQMQQTCINA
jgi:hypothetical protein